MRTGTLLLTGLLLAGSGLPGCSGDQATDDTGGAAGSGGAGGSAGKAGQAAGTSGHAGSAGEAGQGGAHGGQGGAAGQGGQTAGMGGVGGKSGAGGAGMGGAGQAGGEGAVAGMGGAGTGGAGTGGAGSSGGGQAGSGGQGGSGGTAGAGPVCGDGHVDVGEACDGADLAGQSCTSLLGAGATGVLACSTACAHDTSACLTCSDGARNNSETDTDCGGGACPGCQVGQTCATGTDCASGVCSTAGLCVATACEDGARDAGESDTDCGGPGSCARCAKGRTCGVDSDCASGACRSGVCVTKVVFQTSNIKVKSGPTRLAVGDVNGDGHADLLVTVSGSDAVNVLLGDGKGGFAVSSFATGLGPTGIALGDVNKDGKLDAAIGTQKGAGVSVHLGQGNGTFGAAALVPSSTGPSSVALADLDGNGSLDLAINNQTTPGGIANVRIVNNKGNGSFAGTNQEVIYYPAGLLGMGITSGDLNGDGLPELIVGNQGDDAMRVQINEDGFLAPFASFPACADPLSFRIADMTGDGQADVVVGCGASSAVSLMVGDGQGSFTAAAGSPFALSSRAVEVTVLDVDGDGHPDIAGTNDKVNTLSLLLSDGSGGFVVPAGSPFPSGDSSPVGLVTGDFNEDGKPDLATTNTSSDTVSIYLNQTL